jgi:hypothetical protein
VSVRRSLAARFSGPVLEGHKGCAVEVPFDPKERWGTSPVALRPGRRGHRVSVRIGSHAFASAVVPRSRRWWLLLDPDVLKKAKLSPGDTVSIEIRPAEGA